ncbi:DNA excision repair protein ERCC-6 [Fistulifera solaris]|uniref:DNA excision repair protein ERCC-6 n=1 Tax=Fistulifera solaris TaxID=1519565 RepID=A0A1Z5J7J9_FISSO|nr:DNA excision repair protein ERCC-6 [Fistulifera solaris]|eukprot:GAX09892.1 DNA excision repair protein ERCC-6 [Fistulifera solaris]
MSNGGAGGHAFNSNDEANVLASVAATLQDQDVYEDMVLREAAHALVPSLVSLSDDSSPKGFPSLNSLAPSNPPIEVLYRVLSNVRKQQKKEEGNELFYLQEQMILALLSDRVTDVPVRRDEVEWERKRSEWYSQMEHEGVASAFPQRQQLGSSGGVDVAAKHRRRVPLMKRKEQQSAQVDEEVEDTVKDKQELRRLREQRQKRRRERLGEPKLLPEPEYYDEDVSSDEAEFDMQENRAKKQKSGADGVATPLDANVVSETQSLKCPVCSQELLLVEGDDRDTQLARHMDSCQRVRRSSRHQPPGTDSQPKRPQTTKLSRKRPRVTVVAHISARSIDDYEEDCYTDRVDDWIESGLTIMKEMKERDILDTQPGERKLQGGLYIPAWINNRLFGYQRESLEWMWELHQQQVGGIIGDEMGLGKTVQVSSFLGVMAASRKLRSILVVAPATMLQHWLNELSTWAPGIRRIVIHSSGELDGESRTMSSAFLRKMDQWLKRVRVDRVNEAIDAEDRENMEPHCFCGTGYAVVTTYENVRRNADIYANHNWSYVVLDEAQKIRNPDAEITLACKKIRTPHRLAMSGTPIQNDLRELWSLFDFVYPGRLGTLPAFETEFGDPIKRGGYSNASPMQVQLAYRCALTLRDLINPYLLRRQKKEVKEVSRMPSKTEHVLFCRITQRQRDMYEAYIRSDNVTGLLRGRSNRLLAAITMLRKICNHPDLVCDPDESSFQAFLNNGNSNKPGRESDSEDALTDFEDVKDEETLMERSGKLEVLSKILPLWNKQGHRVLIFCQWKMMLDIIQRFMLLKGWKFGRLDGNTNVGARQRLVDEFNSDESYFALLCTTRTGGVGLNLTGANRIILYDPDFNPSTDAQARERAWRFGQEKEVTIYRLICAGTIEEKIYQRQIFKTALSNKILQDPKQRRLFSQREIHDLFSLSADSSSVRSGGVGITDTGKVTKGVGVVDMDQDVRHDAAARPAANADNEETLRKVMKSKGLAGVFDHHYLEGDPSRKSVTVREMEDHAKRVAKEAVRALEKSLGNHDPFTPTWTGTDETAPMRFGGSKRPALGEMGRGIGPNSSSRDVLASIRQKKEAVETAGPSLDPEHTEKYADLLLRIKNFVRQRNPSTDQILEKFDDVSDCDVAILRRLLKSVARLSEGRWYPR